MAAVIVVIVRPDDSGVAADSYGNTKSIIDNPVGGGQLDLLYPGIDSDRIACLGVIRENDEFVIFHFQARRQSFFIGVRDIKAGIACNRDTRTVFE